MPHVLLIEEDAAIAALFAHVLTEDGYALVLAQTGANPCRDPPARYAVLDRLRAATRAPIVICTRHPGALYADHRARGYAAVLE